MKTDVMFSSKTDLWATPQAFFDELNKEFGFATDVCAIPENAKCERFFSPEMDGLKQEWTGVCWCNPPYGKEIGKWVKKAHESVCTTVALLPAKGGGGGHYKMLHLGLEEPRLDLDVGPRAVGEPFVPMAATDVVAPDEQFAPAKDGV
jgi:hypothetical protein